MRLCMKKCACTNVYVCMCVSRRQEFTWDRLRYASFHEEVRTYKCICVYKYMHIFTHTNTCAFGGRNSCRKPYICACVCKYMRIFIICVYVYTHTRAFGLQNIGTTMYICVCVYVHTHTFMCFWLMEYT